MPDINVNKLSEALNTKADIDLNNTGVFSTSEGGVVNLTSSTPANASGKEVTSAEFIKSDIQSNLLNYTTNRILEIPQNIKLELNNGTLTLKAGSKVYIPNGPDVFDEYIVQSDIIVTDTMARTVVLFVNNSGSNLFYDIHDVYSGSTQPSFDQFAAWYDTANNIVKVTADGGSSWVTGFSLPICIATSASTNGFTSIDKVFNGLGYIGSTVFVLPGVKTVVPDGRNEDGTCKNKAPSTVKSVKTLTISRADTAYIFTNFVSSVIATHHYICSKTKPTVTKTTLWYNPETNLPSQVLSNGTVMTPYGEIPLAKFTSDSTGKITSFEPYTVDSVVNSNASNFSQVGRETIVGWGMPDYSAGYSITSSETEKWISPSNGVVRCVAVTNEIVRIKVNNVLIAGSSAPAGTPDVSIWAIVGKGDSVNMYKSDGTAARYQAFYPMKGG